MFETKLSKADYYITIDTLRDVLKSTHKAIKEKTFTKALSLNVLTYIMELEHILMYNSKYDSKAYIDVYHDMQQVLEQVSSYFEYD